MSRLSSTISVNIIRTRQRKGLTQQQLAKIVGVSRGTIARYESDDAGLDVKTLSRIAHALEVDELDLVARESGLMSSKDIESIVEVAVKASLKIPKDVLNGILRANDSQIAEIRRVLGISNSPSTDELRRLADTIDRPLDPLSEDPAVEADEITQRRKKNS